MVSRETTGTQVGRSIVSRFTVTAVFTVDANATADAVQLEADRQLRDLARSVHGYRWSADDGRSASLDSVTVEQAPDPEPVLTFTASELEAHIAACVAEAIAEANASA
jgi:hypothetical protein